MHSRYTFLGLLLGCGMLLLVTQAADTPKPADADNRLIDPATGAAASAAGVAAGLPLSIASNGAISAGAAASVIANKVIAADSAGKALSNAVALVGTLFAGHTSALTQAGSLAGKVLVEVVRAITSLKIAGSQLAAAGVNTAFGGLVDKISEDAKALGSIYTELMGEFGRAVGGTVSAYQSLAGGAGRLLNPVNVGLDVINFNIGNLISFLQGAVDVTATGGAAASAALAPFIGTLQAVKGVLGAFATALTGPAANPIEALDGALQAAGDVLGVPNAAGGLSVGSFVHNVNTALGLLSKFVA